ncbi:hypothetical protein [Natrialbaceae archaeon AArc-T1-2]|uniref:hypothetical protein n=1 Tax=Natrialbaceae archaeon AArc-T1-2 TaxID=3053904 RepID=UPI00255AF51E|nr:hypothetical protein [Natrialbaceae archaeon AArc-T1-2]WIV67100.1 hypothetical protein QQ977_15665 [Natrialbaceae archaeon AArc-T1-2]
MSATDAKTDESAHNSPQPTQATDREVREALEGDRTGDGITRRQALRRGATTAGAIAAIGAGGSKVAPQYAPIGRAQAAPPLAGAVMIGAYAGARYTYSQLRDEDPDIDSDDVIEDQIYHAAETLSTGRESVEAEVEAQYTDGDGSRTENPENTPYGRAAYQDIRAAVARAAVDGDGESDAISASHDALDRRTTIAVINQISRWNDLINGLAEQITLGIEEGVHVLHSQDDDTERFTDRSVSDIEEEYGSDYVSSDPDGDARITPVEASQVNDDSYAIWEWDLDLPVDPDEIDEYDGDSYSIYALCPTIGEDMLFHPLDDLSDLSVDDWTGDHPVVRRDAIWAHHSDLPTIRLITLEVDGGYRLSLRAINEAYINIQSDIPDLVESLYAGFAQGELDPADILSSQGIVDQFADSSEQSRLAAELLAVGAEVPDETGYRATISHPDLEADELEGLLYPQFGDAEPVSITPGTVLESDDYDMAYFGYESAIDDSFETELLSGDEPLEVIDTDGLEDQQTVDGAGDTAGDDGRVIVHEGDDPPEPIADPTHEDYDGWKIRVYGETNDHTADLTDVIEDGDDYVLEQTDLEYGETVESVEIVPSVDYSRSIDYVADPTEVDSEETIERMDNLRDQVDELEEALDDDDDGGVALPGMPDDPFEAGGALAGFAIIAVVITAVVGFVTSNIPFLGD